MQAFEFDMKPFDYSVGIFYLKVTVPGGHIIVLQFADMIPSEEPPGQNDGETVCPNSSMQGLEKVMVPPPQVWLQTDDDHGPQKCAEKELQV